MGMMSSHSEPTNQLTDQSNEEETQETHKPTQYASPEELKFAIQELKAEFPDPQSITTDPGALRTHGLSENSYHPAFPHSVIVCIQSSCIKSIFTFQKVRPKSTEDVVKIVNLARKHRVPIIPYSGATSLEGHFSGVSRLCSLHTVTSA